MDTLSMLLGTRLSREQAEVADALLRAHLKASVENNNISRSAFVNAWSGSGSVVQSVASGLLTVGGIHAPVLKARDVLFGGGVNAYLDKGLRVPGFGNSFYKDKIDPAFIEVRQLLDGSREMDILLDAQQQIKNRTGKLIQINAAAFTAAVAEFCKIPAPLELWFFIAGRTSGWIQLLK